MVGEHGRRVSEAMIKMQTAEGQDRLLEQVRWERDQALRERDEARGIAHEALASKMEWLGINSALEGERDEARALARGLYADIVYGDGYGPQVNMELKFPWLKGDD
jgi:hypothetical protein